MTPHTLTRATGPEVSCGDLFLWRRCVVIELEAQDNMKAAEFVQVIEAHDAIMGLLSYMAPRPITVEPYIVRSLSTD